MVALSLACAAFSALFSSALAETTVGVLVFSRHGDRSSKLFPPTHITDLGLNQAFASGQFFRDRYIAADASHKILNISTDEWDVSQIFAAAPDEALLVNTGTAFLQGLYPPTVSDQGAAEALANGSTVVKPMNGYQYVWLHGEDADAPEATWLKGDVACPAYVNASATYSQSEEFAAMTASTRSFYQSLEPLLDGVFTPGNLTWAHAYDIFDYLNVGFIHNTTIHSGLSQDQLVQLRTLADAHEYALTFNASQPSRSIPGQTFIGKMLTQLNQTVTSRSAPKFNLLVASYNTMQAFFGLVDLPAANPDFFGIPDYASALTFELVTNATIGSDLPSPSDISVRFLFRNGSAPTAPLTAFPLFGASDELTPWNVFVEKMTPIAISTAAQWCSTCGGSTEPFCAAIAPKPIAVAAKTVNMSTAVAGVIGAMVTLGVVGIAAVTAAFMGVRLSSRNRRAAASVPVVAGVREKMGHASDASSA